MVAKMRDLDPGLLAGLQYRRPRGDLDLLAIDGYLGHRCAPDRKGSCLPGESRDPLIHRPTAGAVGPGFRRDDNVSASKVIATYSAACRAAAVRYCSMRRSSSGRKWRIRPCTGQAAPSARAQIVWPSISFETS